MSFFGDNGTPCFGFLVTSPLGFKARVGSALFAIFAEANVTYIPPRFTSGATLADLLAVGVQPVHFPTCMCRGGTCFLKYLVGTCPFWGHWYTCFGFLVTSPLGSKARVGSALFAFLQKHLWCYMYRPLCGRHTTSHFLLFFNKARMSF